MGTRRGRGEGSIERLPSGSYRAVISKTVGGQRRRASKTFRSRPDAVEWKNRHAEAGPAAPTTLGHWLDTWQDLHRARVGPATYKNDTQTARTHLRPGLGAVRLRDLTALKIETWLARLAAADVSQNERSKAGRLLRNVLNAAARAGLIPSNPMTGRVRVPARPEPDTLAYDADALTRLVRAADALGHGPLFRLWADLGLRPGELFGLRTEDVDPARGTVSIRRTVEIATGALKEPKTKGSRRTLPVDPSTLATLRPLLSRGPGVLFPSPATGTHWRHARFAEAVFDPVRTAALLPRGTPYTVRHTTATLLLQAGVPAQVVSERLGHRDVATTLRNYAHVLEGDQTRAAAVMAAILTKSHGGPTAAV